MVTGGTGCDDLKMRPGLSRAARGPEARPASTCNAVVLSPRGGGPARGEQSFPPTTRGGGANGRRTSATSRKWHGGGEPRSPGPLPTRKRKGS